MDYKVLEVNVDDRGHSGVYSLVTNVIKNKPKNIKIDIAAFEKFEDKNNINKLKKYGTKVKYVGFEGNKLIKQFIIYHNLSIYLQNNRYDCIHIHSDVANKLLIGGRAAKKAGIKNIIFHSHASDVDGKYRLIKKFLHMISRKKLKKYGTKFVACSDVAAKWMYPNIKESKIKIINNGIDLKKFRYNPLVREKIRNDLNLKNKLVIGHVGRFTYQKNHTYLIKIFNEYYKKNPNAILLLIGEGNEQRKIKNLVNHFHLQNQVIFYGISNKVNELLQAMDVFILPSHFEGLPIVGVEAQASGLPVIFSNTITKEAKLTPNVKFLPINESKIIDWVVNISNFANIKRKDTIDILKEKKFDIKDTLNQFINLYEQNGI